MKYVELRSLHCCHFSHARRNTPLTGKSLLMPCIWTGRKLNSSSLASSDIAVSGLVDTVSVLNCHTHSPWLKRVPGKLSCPRPFRCHRRDLQPAGWTEFYCSTPHTLAFQIGGKCSLLIHATSSFKHIPIMLTSVQQTLRLPTRPFTVGALSTAGVLEIHF